MLNFNGALSRSMTQFNNLVKPELQQVMNCSFQTVEGATLDEIAKKLDMLAGIDAWSISNHGMRGVALRIQTGKNWRTFTIRNKRASGALTEFEKRKEAIENNFLYPYYTVQAYIDGENLISYAIAKTQELINICSEYKTNDNLCWTNRTGDAQIGQAEFFVISWHEMQKRGYAIRIRDEQ